MSRFVDDQEAEIQTASGLSGAEKLQENEVGTGPVQKDQDIETKDGNNKHRYRKRKSLQEQLLNNRRYKYRERRKKLEKQNSSYKMRKDTREFYGQLDAEREAKKNKEKATFNSELEQFRREKKRRELQKQQNPVVEEKEQDSPTNYNNDTNNDNKLVAYSESESD